MKILIVASFAESLVNFRGSLLKALREKGHEVHVAAPDLTLDVATHEWLTKHKLVCHDIPMARTGLNPIADLRAFWALVKLMRRIRPFLFLGYTVKPVVWGLLAAKICTVPKRVALITGLGYAFTGTSTGLRHLVKRVVLSLYRVAIKGATLVFFQNPDDCVEFRALGLLPAKMPVTLLAGSGIDLQHFTPQPLPPEPIKFLLIARLLGDKGIREYITAACALHQQWPAAQFHLVGGANDPSPDSIPKEEIEKLCEAGHVNWHGHLSDVRAAITDAHVYVLPSYREGTPRTVLEAMAMARPILTTDAPGCRQTVISGENGFLVPVKDAGALAEAMAQFLKNPDLIQQMGVRSRQLAETKFDVLQVNARMMQAMGLND